MRSNDNVALARDAIEAFNRGDLDWLLERITDDFELDWTRSRGPLSAVYRGADGATDFIRDQWDIFDEFVMEPSDFIDRGRHVVVPNTVHARGRSGIEVSAAANHVFTFEPDRRVSRVAMYQELEQALAATVQR